MTTPPPMVCSACASRTMKTSPEAAQIGASNTSCTRALAPHSGHRFPEDHARDPMRRAQMYVQLCAPVRHPRCRRADADCTSSRVLGTSARRSASQSPRASAALLNTSQIQQRNAALPDLLPCRGFARECCARAPTCRPASRQACLRLALGLHAQYRSLPFRVPAA